MPTALKIQSKLKGFSIRPKGESGDFTVSINFSHQEGPGGLEEIISTLGPINGMDVVLSIELIQNKMFPEERL
jgi:hypothetical protein